MDETTEEKKKYLNKIGQGRYFSQGSLRRLSVPAEIHYQVGWQDGQNLRVELREEEGKKVLIISEL